MDITLWPVPILDDNYVWVLQRPGRNRVAVVDPGAAAPVAAALAARDLELGAILVTHHHQDHVAGIPALLHHQPAPVYAPAAEEIAGSSQPVADAAQIVIDALDLELTVLAVPGHTRGHVAYVGDDWVLAGDTLFGGGCGRVFEGTMAQMYNSLCRLAALPAVTRVYCAHEYTAANLRFARQVEPANPELQARSADTEAQRARGEATIPSSLACELATNPFLRCHEPAVVAAASAHSGSELTPGAATFTVLRRWKDRF